ncbi:MAG TPA: hypothetical protein VFR43_11870 [Gaiellaceae bacterium]|nr:hypothetical protein [Gaiellaceae bacterium]
MSFARRHRTALILGAIVLLSALARAAGSQALTAPWIAPDEMTYGLLGQSFWESGELAIRGQATAYYSLLYPALIGGPLALGDLATGIAVVQVLQALVMSTVALVAFGWGRTFLDSRLALVAAVLSVLPPALVYSGLLMSEALYYPVVMLCLAALARTLVAPSAFTQGMLLAAVTVAAAVRLQALILLPVLVTAALLDAWFARSAATLRRLAPTLLLVLLAALVGLATAAATEGFNWQTVLGAYGTVAEEAPGPWRVLRELVWHTGGLYLLALGVPLLAAVALGIEAARDGERDPDVRAFLAATLAYSAWLVVQVALFASRYVDHVAERYLVTAAPPLLLALCLWLARGAPRPRAAVVAAAAAVVAVAAIPVRRVAADTAAHDLFTTLPLLDLSDAWSPGGARAALVAVAAALALVFAVLPRRWLPAAVLCLAVGYVGISAVASRDVARFSEREQEKAFGTAEPDWVDRAAAGSDGDVTLLNSGDRDWPSVARMLFWNERIRSVVRLPDASAYGPIPQREVSPRPTGELVDAAGRTVTADLVAAPSTLLLEGEKIAESPVTSEQPGASLWRAGSPVRVRQRVEGLNANGDFAGAVRVSVFGCGPGALALTLLGKSGKPVDVSVDGFPLTTIRPLPNTLWEGEVPAPPYADGTSRCVYELDGHGLVGSTRIEFVPSP